MKESTYLKFSEQYRRGNISKAIEIIAESEIAPIIAQNEAEKKAEAERTSRRAELFANFLASTPNFDPSTENGRAFLFELDCWNLIGQNYTVGDLTMMWLRLTTGQLLKDDEPNFRERTGTHARPAQPAPVQPEVPAEDQAPRALIARHGSAFGFLAYVEKLSAKQMESAQFSPTFCRAYEIATAEHKGTVAPVATPFRRETAHDMGFPSFSSQTEPYVAPKNVPVAGRTEYFNGAKTEEEAIRIRNQQIANNNATKRKSN